jgi:phage terminase large subunit-like protein
MANLDWSLLPWQIECWQDPSRFKVIAAGRRCGKSNLAIKMLLAKALEAPEGSAVLYVAPTLGQARQIAWDALLEQGREVIKAAHVNQMDVTLVTGRKIHIRSGENKDALRGLKLHFAVVDEAAFVPEEVFTKIIRPALADLKGEAVIISTPDGRNHFYEWFKLGKEGTNPEWKSWHLTTKDNPTIPPEEIEEARKTLSSFVFRQEFEANFNNAGQEIFKEEWLKKGKEPQHGSYVIAIDLAGFEEVGKNPGAVKSRLDESAIAIVKVADEGEWWVKEILHGRWDIKETAAKILVAIKEYQPTAVGIERGALKNAVLPFLNDLMRKNNTYAHITDLTHGNKRKQDRIAWALQGRFEHGRIHFNEDENWQEAWDQISMFPTAGLHDDLVDALSYVDQLAISNYNQDYEMDDFEPMDILTGY